MTDLRLDETRTAPDRHLLPTSLRTNQAQDEKVEFAKFQGDIGGQNARGVLVVQFYGLDFESVPVHLDGIAHFGTFEGDVEIGFAAKDREV